MHSDLFRGKALSRKKRIPDSPQAYYEGGYTGRAFISRASQYEEALSSLVARGSREYVAPCRIVHTVPVPTLKLQRRWPSTSYV